ncbi:MAG: efflux RND transporter permease subunit [Planctomycetia bacterium]|nr:efflux RND transporter permease subunit [Planctomycetia bacterium]
MSLPEYALKHPLVVWFVLILLTVGGLVVYFTLGRLEDPEFTIKTAVVVTVYPGADARQVEQNVTDTIETAIYRLKEVHEVRSFSKPGLSIIYVDLKASTKTSELDTCWTVLRHKLQEVQRSLPVEALPPFVKDDFSQVYGIVLALEADDGITQSEHQDAARRIRRELSLLEQVGRCELWGVPSERIEVTLSRAKMAEFSVPPVMVFAALLGQNLSPGAGSMTCEGDIVRLRPTGKFQTVEEIGELILPASMNTAAASLMASLDARSSANGILSGAVHQQKSSLAGTSVSGETGQVRLRDIAEIRRVPADPPMEICRFNGKNAIAIAVSPCPNGNVIQMGKDVRRCTEEIMADLPCGLTLGTVAFQPENVELSINQFMKNLQEAIFIVAIVVMIAMGWKSGLLITSSLLIVILASIVCLPAMGVVFQRVSLAAFIIALGILVDNAIVVGDLIIVRMQRGWDRRQACIDGTLRTAKQLLAATVVGGLVFLPIALVPENVGDYCRSLFLVVGCSLLLSWLIAMVHTPIVYWEFVHVPPVGDGKDPHSGPVFRTYRRMLEWTLRHRFLTLGMILFLCVTAVFAFEHVDKTFFPRAQRRQFWVDYWIDEGSSIHDVEADLRDAEAMLLKREGVTSVATFIGSGPPRFYLPYEPQLMNSSYGHMVVNVERVEDLDKIMEPVELELKNHYPQARIRVQRFALGIPTTHEVEARFRGPDPNVLRRLGAEAEKILRESPYSKDVNNNWRQKILTLAPRYSQSRGQRMGLARLNLNLSLSCATSGIPVGVFSENEKNLPIYVRGTERERDDLLQAENIPIWSLTPESASLGELSSQMDYVWEDASIYRFNRVPAVVIGADAFRASWMQLLTDVRSRIEAIELPAGYTMEWGGQYAESKQSVGSLSHWFPPVGLVMVLILVFLFNDWRQPLIIVMTVPLAMIGITIGMLLLGKSFGFMAILGIMGLLGMMVRNGVVLMDQIDEEIEKANREGTSRFEAVVAASVERMRPVTVAATTVVVGMVPLLKDVLFDSMAVAMMFGLIFATILTLFVVPVLYALFFRIRCDS